MKQFISSAAEVFSKSSRVHTIGAFVASLVLATGIYTHQKNIELHQNDWFSLQEQVPILVLADADLPMLERSIAYLIRVRDSFAQEAYYSPTEAALLREALHPESFLRSLAPLERARRVMASTPTQKSARTYHQLLLYSLATYRADIARLTTAMSSLTEGSYAFPRGVTSVEHIRTTLSLIDEQVHEKQRMLAQRRLCRNILVRTSCPSKTEFPTYTPIRVTGTTNARVMSFLSTLYEGDSRYVARKTIPVITHCDNRRTNGDAPVLVSYVVPPEDKALFARKTQGTSDSYYRDFTKTSSSSVVTTLQREGYEYEHQASGHHYLCPDAGVDASNLTRNMLYERGSRNALQFAHASYELEFVIAEIALENTFATRMAQYGSPLSLSSLFLSRSGISTLFLFGNHTLLEESPSLFSATTTYPLENFGLTSLVDTPQRDLPSIMEALRASRKRYENSVFSEQTTPTLQHSQLSD